MRAAGPLLAAIGVVAGFLVVVALGTDDGSLGSETTDISVFAGPESVATDDLAVVESYWHALDAGDERRALELMAQPRPDWEAESGLVAFHSALDRQFDAVCESETDGWRSIVSCDVALAGGSSATGERPGHVEVFRLANGRIVDIERSEVAALADAVLVRQATLTQPDAFVTECVERPDRWYRIHGVVYDGRCGGFLALFAAEMGPLMESSATNWLLSSVGR